MKDFITENYILFLVIAIILVFAMIGYFVEEDKKKNPNKYIKTAKKEEANPLADIKPGMTLGDAIDNSKKPIDNTPKEEVLIVEEPK